MISRLRTRLMRLPGALRGIWRLHPPVLLAVKASPAVVLGTLGVGARPSTQRLHLRELFRDGRRYYIEPVQNGFRMTSNSRERYSTRRRRTRVAAILNGTFSSAEAGDTTFVHLRARMSMTYFLSGMLIPAFITSIIVYMPWGVPTIAILIGLLFGLSLTAHRLNAALQATEMVYFVRKVFEDLPQPEVMPLGAETPDVVLQDIHSDERSSGFSEQWQKFVERKTEHESGTG